MTTMADTDIVEALAKREGYTKSWIGDGLDGWRKPDRLTACFQDDLPDYLNDRNALQPILDGLTLNEKAELQTEIDLAYSKWLNQNTDKYMSLYFFYLTIKPRDLAQLLVTALKLGKEGK
jgi:hypothetical protein